MRCAAAHLSAAPVAVAARRRRQPLQQRRPPGCPAPGRPPSSHPVATLFACGHDSPSSGMVSTSYSCFSQRGAVAHAAGCSVSGRSRYDGTKVHARPLSAAPPSGRSSAVAAALAASQVGAARKGLLLPAAATSAPSAVPMRSLSRTSDFSACSHMQTELRFKINGYQMFQHLSNHARQGPRQPNGSTSLTHLPAGF